MASTTDPVHSFLQSKESGALMSETTACFEHSVASVTCLLSGINVFGREFPDQERQLRVVQGLHSFHVYANEYWLDHVLVAGGSEQGIDQSSQLYALMSRLSSDLSELQSLKQNASGSQTRDTPSLEAQLLCLKGLPGLLGAAKTTLVSRTTRYMNDVIPNTRKLVIPRGEQNADTKNPENDAPASNLSGILASYQRTVQTLLLLQCFPGGVVSMEVFEQFNRLHKSTAFTCQLGGCARATIGFDDGKSRLEHERNHIQPLYCKEPGCQYPPFTSVRALKNHAANHHKKAPVKPRSIRVTKTPTNRPINPSSGAQQTSIPGPLLDFDGLPLPLPNQAPLYRSQVLQKIPLLTEKERIKYASSLDVLWERFDSVPRGTQGSAETENKIRKFGELLLRKVRYHEEQKDENAKSITQKLEEQLEPAEPGDNRATPSNTPQICLDGVEAAPPMVDGQLPQLVQTFDLPPFSQFP